MVIEYLDTQPDPETYDFLKHNFDALDTRHGGIVATSFRGFPSYPQRFIEVVSPQPDFDADLAHAQVQPLRVSKARKAYTEDDLYVRPFVRSRSARAVRKRQIKAA